MHIDAQFDHPVRLGLAGGREMFGAGAGSTVLGQGDGFGSVADGAGVLYSAAVTRSARAGAAKGGSGRVAVAT